MEENLQPDFKTTSKCPPSTIIALAVIMLLAGGAVAALAWGSFKPLTLILICVVYVLLCAAGLVYFAMISRWELSFVKDRLYLKNLGNKKEFEVFDTPASDFIMRLTSKEKDEGTLKIAKTVFNIGA
ncbi:MAG: hypothetical protein IJP68_08665, partial [Selenomonadaceae bacterium]|nr:hypothetical protein [Selenomonadaceae bacterium]